jgi:hypothetical protein
MDTLGCTLTEGPIDTNGLGGLLTKSSVLQWSVSGCLVGFSDIYMFELLSARIVASFRNKAEGDERVC